MTIVAAVLNVLSAAPAVALGSTLVIKVSAETTVLGWAAVLLLVARPQVSQAYRGE